MYPSLFYSFPSFPLSQSQVLYLSLSPRSILRSLSFPYLVSAVFLTRSDPLIWPSLAPSRSILSNVNLSIYFLAPCFLCFFLSLHPSCILISSSLYLSPLYIYLSIALSLLYFHLSHSALSVTLHPPPTPAVSLTNVLGTYSLCLFYHCTRTENT